jgi:hypothetical protein
MSSKRDPSNPAWRLFHERYRVGIAEAFFHDPKWVAQFGRPTSGNKKVDQQLLNTERVVWWTPAEIVELWSMGADVTFKNWKEDPFIVYKDIQNHLADWSRYIEYSKQSLNTFRNPVPIDDLIKFSLFADCLFPMTEQVDPTKLHTGRLNNYRTFARRNRGNKNMAPPQEIKEEYSLDGTHIFTPMFGDVFSTKVAEPTKEEHTKNIKDSLKDKHHQSFTDILEEFMVSTIVNRNENEL